MGLQDELQDAKQSAKTHEAICQSLIAENKKYRLALQYIADDSETQGHPEYIGMNRLAGYAKKTLAGSDWLDEFEKDERIAELEKSDQVFRKVIEKLTADNNGMVPNWLLDLEI